MIAGLPPGKLAATEIVGKSICGSGDTGKTLNATPPASAIAAVSSVVATGRLMNGADRFMLVRRHRLGVAVSCGRSRKLPGQAVEENIDNRRGVKRQHLAH